MADTVTIRLDPDERRRFDAEAAVRGVGPSTLARDLVNERLGELRRAQILRESAEAGRRFSRDAVASQSAELFGDDLDPQVEDAMAPYEDTVGATRP